MKISVSNYSFGMYNSSLGVYGVIDKAAEMGFDGIEFVDITDDIGAAKDYRQYAESKGLEVVALCIGANFAGPDVKDEIKRVQKKVDIAAALGAKLMRHDVATDFVGGRFNVSYRDLVPDLSIACREVTKYAEQLGVQTMTENHGFFSEDSDRIEMLVTAVKEKNFGVLIDIGNFMCVDEDPTKAVGLLTPYAKHVHAKDFHLKSGVEIDPGDGWFRTRAGDYLRGAIIGHGDAKVCQSLSILRRRGYNGYVSIEFEGLEDNLRGIQIGLQNLKRFMEL